jgi:hypothetical protein
MPVEVPERRTRTTRYGRHLEAAIARRVRGGRYADRHQVQRVRRFVPAPATSHPFSTDNVRDFVVFLWGVRRIRDLVRGAS